MTYFVDTFALLAWLNPIDGAHAEVRDFLGSYSGRLVTTEWVLMEVADALAKVKTRKLAIEFLQAIRSDFNYEVIDFDEDFYQAGFELYSKRPDKDWSLTDCISFSVMEKRQLTEALTQDHHFAQAGYRAVFEK